MKRCILVFLLIGAALGCFANDYYRVKVPELYSREDVSTANRKVCRYKQGDMLVICEYYGSGKHRWGRIADKTPSQWIPMSGLQAMNKDEVYAYYAQSRAATPAPQKQTAASQKQTKRHPSYRVSSYKGAIIAIKILVVIYSIVFFILLYNESKRREQTRAHALYGFCCIALLFWLFFPGKWQWLWVGFAWAGLCYPFAFAKFLEKEKPYEAIVLMAALILSGLSTWFFIRKWDLITEYIGYLNGWEVTFMVIGNIVVTCAFGAFAVIDRCPLCRYYCAGHEIDKKFDGSSYYDVVRREHRDLWDHKDQRDEGDRIVITNYYRRETTETTSTYRKDYYTSTHYCPHCHGRYKTRYSVDNLVNRTSRTW